MSYTIKCILINIDGTVQGVGFRPFIYRTAKKFQLNGYIINETQGVTIELEGLEQNILEAITFIKENAPKGALIRNFSLQEKSICNYNKFEIRESLRENINKISMSPDLAMCEDCTFEFYNPDSRFYKYPFISCASCGPRLTILKELPYDRPYTTMKYFEMCRECEQEYSSPEDRRHHAQTISCHNCGPKLYLGQDNNPIEKASEMLRNGKILAVKGIGGYHIACNAENEAAVGLLRERKKRMFKPFAVMMELSKVVEHCYVSEFEKELLLSKEAPIVLLKQKQSSSISQNVNPNLDVLGVMLPYTGIHKLLLEKVDVLIMTSGNVSGDSIVISDEDVDEKLSNICDGILKHDRTITIGCDDSVVRAFKDKTIMIRRSRGYVPAPIQLKSNGDSFLACGGDLKNTFCVFANGNAYLSPHIGDLLNNDTYNRYINNIETFKNLLNTKFDFVVCDLHPEYQSVRYANNLGLPTIKVQHHYAHILSTMGEYNINDEVIGVAFDGTGFGDDNNIWGGEFFTATRKNYIREYHLEYVKMPGGEFAIKEPWRMALSYLYSSFESLPDVDFINKQKEENVKIILKQLDNGINAPLTSSMGRLFEGVSSMIGVRDENDYEGQAAIELEIINHDTDNEVYWYRIKNKTIFVDDIIRQIIEDMKDNIDKSKISNRFHNTIIEIIIDICGKINKEKGIKKVVLAGGVFQNMKLMGKAYSKLVKCGFQVFINNKIPINDAGISFGQVVYGLESNNQK